MGYYISADNGQYYEGDKARHLDHEVPQRPSPMHVWSGGAWVEGAPVVPEAIDALDGLVALHAAGLDAAYTAWASSPDRTFLERAFIDKAKTWRRDDPVLIAGAAVLGLTEAQLDALFLSAVGA